MEVVVIDRAPRMLNCFDERHPLAEASFVAKGMARIRA
jgi:hypothetical protein